MGNATSAYMVCRLRSLDHWLWFHPPIESLRCIIVSRFIVDGSLRHRWWSCWQAQRTSVSIFQKMKSQSPWSANAYREAHIWHVHRVPHAWWLMEQPEAVHHTYHVSKVVSPVIRRGATVPIDCRVVLQLKAECFRTRERHYNGRLQTCATPSTRHFPLDGRNIALPVSVPDRGGQSLQTPASWMSVSTVHVVI
jgi:hypothetical protein